MAERIIIPEKVIASVSGRAVPKPADDQNTDDMVYGGELNRISFKGYGKDFFAEERKKNPNHPIDDPRFKGANILIAGSNYGCGSSREHAPQAHLDFGIKGLVAVSYAGIFQGNCAAIGLVAVTAPREHVLTLADYVNTYPQAEVRIDLQNMQVYGACESKSVFFKCEMSDKIRQSFLDGTWDAMALLRANPQEVAETMARIPYFGFK